MLDQNYIQNDINYVYKNYRNLSSGELPEYIPELKKKNSSLFAIAISTPDGNIFFSGDAKKSFPIESISKPFVYGLALEDHGRDLLVDRVGVSISGLSFNSIIDPIIRRTKLQNPLGNAGAMATNSLIKGKSSNNKLDRIYNTLNNYAGRSIYVDENIFSSEMYTNNLNRAIAFLYKSYGLFYDEVEPTIFRYTKICSLMINTIDLAIMGSCLLNYGKNPQTGFQVVSKKYVRDILSVMLFNGLYDDTGKWIFNVGLPAKSGVGGGILTIAPHIASIATFSPLLDDVGNSIRGMKATEMLIDKWNLHLLS